MQVWNNREIREWAERVESSLRVENIEGFAGGELSGDFELGRLYKDGNAVDFGNKGKEESVFLLKTVYPPTK